MYLEFYRLTEKPFALTPNPAFLYPSKKHRLALTMLQYGLLNQEGFIVISGGIGTGKTTLIHEILGQLDRRRLTCGLITNAHEEFGDLLQWVLMAFGQEASAGGKADQYRNFLEFIAGEFRHQRRTVLIIDEAQNLSPATLEELRMLVNVNSGKAPALQIVLVGQRQLLEKLRRPDLEQFAQRVAVNYRLEPLDPDDTAAYIRHRLALAGSADPALFSDAACQAVHRHSGGIPRIINLICDTSLVYGFADDQPQIGVDLVEAVVSDRNAGGLPFQVPEGTADAGDASARQAS